MRFPLWPAALVFALAAPARAQESCIVCHGAEGQIEARGVHATAGIGCVDCHGGTAGAMDVAGAHGAGLQVPHGSRAGVELCSSCHADAQRMRGFALRTDQRLLYDTSNHGKRLAQEDDPNVATCITCHGAHGVFAPTDARSPVFPARQPETCGHCHGDAALMQRYELGAQAPALYRSSVHGRALLERGSSNSPTCTTCHGSHGATPPGLDEVGRVCGRCHGTVQALFEAGPHRAPARAGLFEECVACHGNHAVLEADEALLVGGEPGHCGSCHQRNPELVTLGVTLHDRLAHFDERLDTAGKALSEAARRGLFVERERDLLGRARDARAQASPLVHSLSDGALNAHLELGNGMVAETFAGLARQERELGDRQVLVLAFLVGVLLLAGVLLVHAREVAGRATGVEESFEHGAPAARGEDAHG